MYCENFSTKILDTVFDLYSFDIFDTLITRRVATPAGIFTLMQEKIKNNAEFSDFIRNNFYKIRIQAEQILRKRKESLYSCREITFDDIYECIQENYYLTDEQKFFLKKLEFETELKNITPIIKNIQYLEKLVKSNKRVVLISNMYFSSKEIKILLTHVNPVFENIKIYVSSEYNVSKSNGLLYQKVRELENIDYRKWVHFGDNKLSDIKRAKIFEITTIQCQIPELAPIENFFMESSSGIENQIAIGTSRLVRLNNKTTNTKTYDFGTYFAAPILYNYVSFVIEQALARGFKTLYFIARDGYIPQKIADIIISKRGLSIKTKYIYGSRLAWRIPSISNYEQFLKTTLSEYKDKMSIDFLAYRLGISSKLLGKLLGIQNTSRKLSHEKIKEITELITTDKQIIQAILDANLERKNTLFKYMEQELDFSRKNIAFVDLHGTGKTQDCLSDILNEKHNCTLHTFYLTTYFAEQFHNSYKYTYCKSIPWDLTVELLSKSADGQTIGYKQCGDKIIPVTEKSNGKNMLDWGLQEYIQGIEDYTNTCCEFEIINNINLNNIQIFENFINYIRFHLNKKEAEILGTIPYKRVGKEEKNVYAAPRISFIKVLGNFILCKKPEKFSEFIVISKARSSKLSNKILKITEKYPTLQKFLFNIYIHKEKKQAYIRILGIKISFNHLLRNQKEFENVQNN